METETQFDNGYLEKNLDTTKESNIKHNIKKFMKEPFNVLTFIIVIYPILPLTLLSLFVSLFGLIEFFSKLITKGYSYKEILAYTGLLIWLLGGTAGFIGLIRILKNKIDLTSLFLIIYGAISYSIIAVMYIGGSFRNPSWLSLLHMAYIVFSLVIVGILIIKTFRAILTTRNKANV